ncbi:MAG TPA: peptide MFS transporter [Polyangiaceae bacterium]|jgi:POT family proton-dependent oligopeptide transporter|nr:peptide MFS transporter [Polyangiaceae bacterium]
MSTSHPSAPPVPSTAFERRFKHPLGLVILFFTEMWERFSYYGMRGLLKLYMVNYLFTHLREPLQGCRSHTPACELVVGDPSGVLFWDRLSALLPSNTQEAASLLYGTYTALVYATPFFGGLLADRLLGQRKTVVIGALLMAAGHFVMAIESSFFVALLLLILGNGAFKPNVSTQVGGLYADHDSRRDGAYTIFYMGVNLGAFLSNLVCGTLAAVYGWHWGFGAAGVGMLIGLSVYLLGGRHLASDAHARTEQAHQAGPLNAQERRRVWALCALCLLNVVFWAVYEQQGNTMQTWADERTSWPSVFGFQIPSTWFQSFNPLAIVVLAPLLDIWWRRQARRGTEPSSVTKMAIGCVLLGVSFVIMIIGARSVGQGVGSPFWPLACTLLLTVGELYLSPIGLSLVSRVAPLRVVSMMMGVWLAASFVGNFLSGMIGVLYTRWSAEAFFALLTALGIGAGLAIQWFNRPLAKAMNAQDGSSSEPVTD